MKKWIIVLIFLICISQCYAAVCTVMGFVTLADGTNAPRGIEINVSNTNKSIEYSTITGGRDYPYENFYVQSLSCDFYDEIVVEIENNWEAFIFDHYPYELNLTIPVNSKPNVEKAEPVREHTYLFHGTFAQDQRLPRAFLIGAVLSLVFLIVMLFVHEK